MSTLLISILALASILISRWLLGRWLNHLAIYSLTWGISLSAYSLQLIAYNPISTVAWVYIVVAWVSFFLGSVLVVFSTRDREQKLASAPDYAPSVLRTAIFILSILAIISLGQQMRQIRAQFGSVTNAVFLNPNEIYSARFEGDLQGEPYLGFLGLAATGLAGAYTARVKKFTLTAIVPMLYMAVGALLSMQRGGILIAIGLFSYAYVFSSSSRRLLSRRFLIISSVVAVSAIAGFLMIASHRGTWSALQGQSQGLNNAADYLNSFPILYFYVSANGPTFSQYLMHPEIEASAFFGAQTFAPIWRAASKLGFLSYVPYYTPFYNTPTPGNQGTYLAYVHSDFGPAGIVIVPVLLSALLTVLAQRNARDFSLCRLMIYVHLLVVVTFSFSGYYVSLTYWLVSLVVSSLVGWWIDRATTRRRIAEAHP